MPEIEVRYIFDEEDERVLLCQILVPLVPKIYEETDRRCYGSKRREEEEGGGGRRREEKEENMAKEENMEDVVKE